MGSGTGSHLLLNYTRMKLWSLQPWPQAYKVMIIAWAGDLYNLLIHDPQQGCEGLAGLNTVMWRLHSLSNIKKKDNDLASWNKRKHKAFIIP